VDPADQKAAGAIPSLPPIDSVDAWPMLSGQVESVERGGSVDAWPMLSRRVNSVSVLVYA
jgi:hypothetical protein